MHTLGGGGGGWGAGGPTSDTEFVFAKLLSIPGIDFQLTVSYDDPIIYTNSFTNTCSVCMGPGGGRGRWSLH